MKIISRYGVLVVWLLLSGCACKKSKILERRVSLWRLDRNPYGTKYAYDNLSHIFPEARIFASKRFPALFQVNSQDTIRSLIIINERFEPEDNELNSIIRFAAAGNQVFISSFYFADTVLAKLKLKVDGTDYNEGDSTDMSLLDPGKDEWVKYKYPGYSVDQYFEAIDTGHTKILGTDVYGRPDFVRLRYLSGGAIYIHLNPMAFSNFFLLHGKNKSLYDMALSWIPASTGVVEWSDYFRYAHHTENFSSLHFILSNRSLRWAFWLTLITFILLFLFESKRKQRPIPLVPPVRNASEDFVKTVGRLYFQQKNNQNLAEKMVTGLLEHVRSAYNLPTSSLNEEFAKRLAFRTGRPESEINQLIQSIHNARLNPGMTDQELMDLHRQINQFSKPIL